MMRILSNLRTRGVNFVTQSFIHLLRSRNATKRQKWCGTITIEISLDCHLRSVILEIYLRISNVIRTFDYTKFPNAISICWLDKRYRYWQLSTDWFINDWQETRVFLMWVMKHNIIAKFCNMSYLFSNYYYILQSSNEITSEIYRRAANVTFSNRKHEILQRYCVRAFEYAQKIKGFICEVGLRNLFETCNNIFN